MGKQPTSKRPGVPMAKGTSAEVATPARGMALDEDSYEQGAAGARKAEGEAAPEVSQGAWRERAFKPRATMPKDQLVALLETVLKLAASKAGELDAVRSALKTELLPLLQQALEQAGGDGLDSALRSMFAMRSLGPAKDPLLADLCAQMDRVNRAPSSGELFDEARKVSETVQQALAAPAPQRVSLKVLEKELEGRLDVGALLAIFFGTDDELRAALAKVNQAIEALRLQLRKMMGAQPDAMLWNFARLKAERRVIEAERERRARRGLP